MGGSIPHPPPALLCSARERAWGHAPGPKGSRAAGTGSLPSPSPWGGKYPCRSQALHGFSPPTQAVGLPPLLPSIDFIAWIFSWPMYPCPAPAPQHRGGLGACAGSPLPLPPAWPCHLPVIYCSFGRGGQRGSPRGRTSRAGGQGVAGVGRSRRQPPFVGGRHNDPAQAVCSPRRVITVPGGDGRDTGGGSHTSRGSVTRRRRGPREAGGSSFPWHHLLGGGRSARAAGLRLRRRRGAQTHGQMVVGLKR